MKMEYHFTLMQDNQETRCPADYKTRDYEYELVVNLVEGSII